MTESEQIFFVYTIQLEVSAELHDGRTSLRPCERAQVSRTMSERTLSGMVRPMCANCLVFGKDSIEPIDCT